MIFGLSIFGTTWLTIGIILGLILLFLLGIFYDEDTDDQGEIMLKAVCVLCVSIIWPIVLLFAVCVVAVAIPIYLGKKIKDFIKEKKRKGIEKENFFKELEKSNKKGG